MLTKLVNSLIEETQKAYGIRKQADDKCSFCGNDLDGGYCHCIDSQKINRIARIINQKAELNSRIKLIGWSDCYQETLFENANIPLKYANAKLDSYLAKTDNEVSIKFAIRDYLEDLIANYIRGKNIIFTGNYGTAKTLLESAIGNEAIVNYLTVRFINIVDLIAEVQNSFDNKEIHTEQVIQSYLNCDYLLIDDIDKIALQKDPLHKDFKPSEFVKNLLYRVINGRYENLKPTIISANKSIEILDKEYFGEATISRLFENCLHLEFTNENQRNS